MGSCAGKNKTTTDSIANVKTESPALKNFKIQQSNLVKEKHTDINLDYTFLATLGQGAYGEVKKTINKATGIVRAVKIINKKFQTSNDYNRMMDEIHILKNLDHPNIMKIIEFYQDETKVYIVTEFYEGGELLDRLAKQNLFTETQAANIMKQIFSAVNYCHKNKIVHRDLKPENIVYETIKEDSILKIIDFGTSQFFRQGEVLQKPLGTCYYVAPEVLKKSYTHKCDVWSCGVILYFMLCGRPPFNGNTEKKVLEKVVKGLYEFKDSEWEGVSENAKDLIRKLLEYSPEKRLSADEALNHPWFRSTLGESRITNKSMVIKNLKNFQNFKSEKKLQEAIWLFLVNYFSTKEERSKLLETFYTLDKDKNGTLTREEIRLGYQKIMGKDYNDEDLDTLIKKIDLNNNGHIDYSEFVSATINRANILSQSKLEAAFNLFDVNKDGFLTIDEFKEILDAEEIKRVYSKQGSSLSGLSQSVTNKQDSTDIDVWQQLLNEVDANKDGKLSLQEFKNLMLKMMK